MHFVDGIVLLSPVCSVILRWAIRAYELAVKFKNRFNPGGAICFRELGS